MKIYYENHMGWISNTTLENEISKKTYIEHEEIDGVITITFNTEDYYHNEYHEIHPKLGIKCDKEYFYKDLQTITDKIVTYTEEQIKKLEKRIIDLRTYDGTKYHFNNCN